MGIGLRPVTIGLGLNRGQGRIEVIQVSIELSNQDQCRLGLNREYCFAGGQSMLSWCQTRVRLRLASDEGRYWVRLDPRIGRGSNKDVVDLEIDAKARKVSNRGRWVKVKPKLASDKGLTEVDKKYSANVKLCFNIPRIHTKAPAAPCVKKGLNAI
ncbi:hypothetical protein TIFTF001_018631 [Ficus carica]|uniref:Uncharacterized protein n=1 Tax=Ficus carica TaxID=3494 RepID=A0AA88AA46_FICCA|nr:hypothetical protein TIFTF001_018631 [Ficus carica]